MGKKGFTLVELIATIVVIGLLSALALPQILNQYANSTEELSKQQLQLIEESARSYVLSHASKFPNDGSTYCISLEEMVQAGAMDEGFAKQNWGDSYNSTAYIEATYQQSNLSIQLMSGKGTCN